MIKKLAVILNYCQSNKIYAKNNKKIFKAKKFKLIQFSYMVDFR